MSVCILYIGICYRHFPILLLKLKITNISVFRFYSPRTKHSFEAPLVSRPFCVSLKIWVGGGWQGFTFLITRKSFLMASLAPLCTRRLFGCYCLFYFSCLSYTTFVLTCVYVHVFSTWQVNFQMFDNKNLFPEHGHMDSATVVPSELQSRATCHQAMAGPWGKP